MPFKQKRPWNQLFTTLSNKCKRNIFDLVDSLNLIYNEKKTAFILITSNKEHSNQPLVYLSTLHHFFRVQWISDYILFFTKIRVCILSCCLCRSLTSIPFQYTCIFHLNFQFTSHSPDCLSIHARDCMPCIIMCIRELFIPIFHLSCDISV